MTKYNKNQLQIMGIFLQIYVTQEPRKWLVCYP